MIAVLAVVAVMLTALANMWAGWEKGDRYSAAGAIFLGFLGFGVVPAGIAALTWLAWRTTGWFKSLDMGRNEGSVLRDFAVMAAIAAVPSGLAALLLGSYMPLSFILAAPVCYGIAMWALPWKPEYQHVKVGEALSGVAYGLIMVLAILGY